MSDFHLAAVPLLLPLVHHQYAARQLWFPLTKAVDWWDADFHTLMLHDHVRMTAFHDAIFEVVRRMASDPAAGGRTFRVLDVGAGYGILAKWAAEAAEQYFGSKRTCVYAVEANPVTSARAAYELSNDGRLWQSGEHGDILLLNQNSYRLAQTLAEYQRLLAEFDPDLWRHYQEANDFKCFDLIVSETLGGLADNEDGVALLDDAVECFLRPGGRVIPCQVTSHVVPISRPAKAGGSDDLHQAVSEWGAKGLNARYDAEYKKLKDDDTSPFDLFYDAIIPREDQLSEPAQLHAWTFPKPAEERQRVRENYSTATRFAINRAGTFIGFKGYFRAILAPEAGDDGAVVLDIEPDDIDHRLTSDCWKHQYLPVATPLQVRTGDALELVLDRRPSADHPDGFSYRWKGRLLPADGTDASAYEHQHHCFVPFQRPRAPLLTRMAKTSAIAAEIIHMGATVLPATREEAFEILRDVVDGTIDSDFTSYQARLEKDVTEHEKRVRARFLEGLRERHGDRVFRGVLVSLQTKDRETVWYPHEPDPNPRAYRKTLRYEAYRDAADVEDMVAIVDADAHPEVSADAVFSSLLVIPMSTYRLMSWSEKQELEGVLYLMQLRVFMAILLSDTQKRVELALPALTHELKGLISGLSNMWFFSLLEEPERQLKAALEAQLTSATDREALRASQLAVTPVRPFLSTFGRLLNVWTFAPEWNKVFVKREPPSTVDEWIADVWSLSTDTVKLTSAEGFHVAGNQGLTSIASRHAAIDAALDNAISLDTGAIGRMAIPWSTHTTEWLALTRWLLCASLNYCRHGEIGRGLLQVSAQHAGNQFTLSLRNRQRRTPMATWFPSKANKTGRDIPRRMGMKGSEVLRSVLLPLTGADMDRPSGPDGDPFVLRVSVPLQVVGW